MLAVSIIALAVSAAASAYSAYSSYQAQQTAKQEAKKQQAAANQAAGLAAAYSTDMWKNYKSRYEPLVAREIKEAQEGERGIAEGEREAAMASVRQREEAAIGSTTLGAVSAADPTAIDTDRLGASIAGITTMTGADALSQSMQVSDEERRRQFLRRAGLMATGLRVPVAVTQQLQARANRYSDLAGMWTQQAGLASAQMGSAIGQGLGAIGNAAGMAR